MSHHLLDILCRTKELMYSETAYFTKDHFALKQFYSLNLQSRTLGPTYIGTIRKHIMAPQRAHFCNSEAR